MHQPQSHRIGGVQRQLFQPGNMFRRYCETAVGRYHLADLITYELTMLLTNVAPERYRKLICRRLYPLIFASVGKGVDFGKNLIIRRPKRIYIGNNVTIADYVSLDVKGDGEGIFIADNVSIGAGTILSCTGGRIQIGFGSRVGKRCRLGASKGLRIGNMCHLGDESYLVGAAHAYDRKDRPIIDQPLTCRGANQVGDSARIGKGATIRDGVHIGDRGIVADQSLVISHVPENVRVAGVPAVKVGPVS